jgi:hypothetical protein
VKAVLKRDPYCSIGSRFCTYVSTCADHRANGGSGGSKVLYDVRNLIGACQLCNGWKETVDGEARAILIELGHRVEQASTNAKTLERAISIPVFYHHEMTWFLLEADGTRTPLGDAEANEMRALAGLISGEGYAY